LSALYCGFLGGMGCDLFIFRYSMTRLKNSSYYHQLCVILLNGKISGLPKSKTQQNVSKKERNLK
jgi:hypothetical protein